MKMIVKTLIKIWEFIEGKKTYIVVAVGILYLASQVWVGAMTPQEALEALFILLGIGTTRHGMKTTLDKMKTMYNKK